MKLKQLAATLFIIGVTFWLMVASTAIPQSMSYPPLSDPYWKTTDGLATIARWDKWLADWKASTDKRDIDSYEMYMLANSTTGCGTERWPVKTLADKDGPAVEKTKPKDVTVSQLVSIPAPSRKELTAAISSRFPAEMSVYRVPVLVVGYKVEDDSDFHIVIADPANPKVTMIAEIPAGQCGEGAERASFYAMQAKFVASFSKPTAKFKTLPKPVPATFTGVGFFDFPHGQTGVGKNAFELHPLQDFTLQ